MNIETIKQLIPTIKSQHLVTGLAGVFALVSVQNIAHFFIELHHPFIASWTLGLAIGTALVVLAHLLSEIDMRERKAFLGLLAVTLILVTLSGIIQGVSYSNELGVIGYVLAFTLAATGEIVLPLAHSWHGEAKRRQAVNDAGQRVEEIAAETMIKVMSNTDTAKAQRQAEKRIEALIVAHVDATVTRLMPKGVAPVVAVADMTPRPVTPQPRQIPEMSSSPLGIGASVDDMTAARSDKASDRRSEILAAVDGQDVATFKTAMSDLYGVSVRTIERDLAALEQTAQIVCNGVVMKTEQLTVV